MPFKLHPKGEPDREVARVSETLLTRTARMVSRVDAPVADRVHRARTACKQVRAVLKLARTADRKFYRRENRWLRATARALASLRDAEANVLSFEAILESGAEKADLRRTLEPLRGALLKRRRVVAAPGRAVERRLGAAVARLRKSAERVASWRPEIEFATIAKNFGRAYARARSAAKTARREQSVESFHAWRKAAKACAYQCRLLRMADAPALKRLRGKLEELGRQLGDEHDLSVLREQLETLSRGRRPVVGLESIRAALVMLDVRRAALRTSALKLGRNLFSDRPRLVTARLSQGWRRAQKRTGRKSGTTAG